MYPTNVERDMCTIINTEISALRLVKIEKEARVAGADMDLTGILAKIGLASAEIGVPEHATFEEIVKSFESMAGEERLKLWNAATEARILRLVQGMGRALRVKSHVDEGDRWWFGLTSHMMWWYARQNTENGLELVQHGIPARATESLKALNLLSVRVLTADLPETKADFVTILRRFDYSEDVAANAYNTIRDLAVNVSCRTEGRIQRILRQHANTMVDSLSQDLLTGFKERVFLEEAIRGWMSTATGLPITIWSPSTMEFLEKFASVGVSSETLESVADRAGIALLALDAGIAAFMDGLCRECDPQDESKQLCRKRFSQWGWQVECPERPDFLFSS